VSGQWVAGQCLDGQISYYDENLLQAHPPFVAQVRNNKITKYVPTASSHPRVVFAETKPEAKKTEDKAAEETKATDDAEDAEEVGDVKEEEATEEAAAAEKEEVAEPKEAEAEEPESAEVPNEVPQTAE
jgi:hypothetical protein